MPERYSIALATRVEGPYATATPTWAKLREKLLRPLNVPKASAPVFVPADLVGPRRALRFVRSVSLLVFDLDNKGAEKITAAELSDRLTLQELDAIVYSTPSHTMANPRYRLILRLAKPIQKVDYKGVARAVIELLQISAFVDHVAVEPSRCFYLPACTSANVDDYEYVVTDGQPLDPDDPRLNKSRTEPQPSISASAVSVHLETPENIRQVKAMLGCVSADTDYETYRQIVWSVLSLGWDCAEALLTDWSKTSPDHWAVENAGASQRTLDTLTQSFDATRGTSAGTLIHVARQHGYSGEVLGQTVPNPPFSNLTLATESQGAAEKRSRYSLLTRADLMAVPPLTWVVKNVLPNRGLGCVYGPSGGGKSFLLLDLAAAICEGGEWFGFRTKQTPIVYLCLEGSSGLQKRVKAWEITNERDFPDNFHYLIEDFDLGVAEDVSALVEAAPSGAICVIDTLNRASPGSDENSSSDMGRLLAAARKIEQGVGGLVIICHHTGKDTSKGLRGHSSLHAALDAEIEVAWNRKRNIRTWRSAKLKDERDGFDQGFQLVPRHLGFDSDGDPETSCTVEPTINVRAKPQPKGTRQKPAYDTIKSLLSCSEDHGRGGAPFAMKCVQVSKAQAAIVNGLATISRHKRSNRAKTLIDELAAKGFISTGIDEISGAGWIWADDEEIQS
jgi:hypothetical protein